MNQRISTLILTIGFFGFLSASQVSVSAAGPSCTISFQQVVTDNPNGCSGSEDGRICVTINGTVSDDFELSINNGASWTYGKETVCIEDLPSGSYNLQIKDQGGCVVLYSENPVVLGVDDPVTINEISTTPQTYSELGVLIVTATGLIPLQYRINSGTWQSSEKFFDLEAGTYNVDVKDVNGCIVSDEATVADERCPEFTVDKTTETNCFSPNGSITITIVIGVRPMSYSNDNGLTWQSDSVFSNLSGGLYQLAVKGDNGCVSYNSTTVSTSFIQFSGSSSVVDITGCMGDATGEIRAASFGGQTPKTVTIDDGLTWQSSGIFTGLIAGEYQTIVMDSYGCTDTSIFTITQPIHDTIDFATANNILDCAGDATGSIALDAALPIMPLGSGPEMGAYLQSYSIDGGSTWQSSNFFNNLIAGEYTAVVKVDDCEYPYYLNPVIITEPDSVKFTSIAITPDYGNSSGEISITASGGNNMFEYSIDGGATFVESNSFTALSFGSFDLAVSDGNGCTADSTVTVPDEAVLITNVETTDVTGCYGDESGTITVTATGGSGAISYSIDNGMTWQLSNVFEDLAAGDYTIEAKDEYDIETSWESNPVTIYEPEEISFNYRSNSPKCTGESTGSIVFRSADGGTGDFTFSVDGGVTYTSSNSVTGLAAGSYYLYIKDENGCTKEYDSNPVEITDPLPFEILSVDVINNTSCTENGNGMITILTTSGEGGLQAQFVELKLAEAFGSNYYSIDDTATWQQDNNSFGNLEVGSYQIWAKNPDGCIAEWNSNPVVIEFENPITFKSIDVTGDDGRTNGEIDADVFGGDSPYNYRLDDGVWQLSERFSNLAAGTYSLQVQDSDGCENSTDVTIDSIIYVPDEIFKADLVGNALINTNSDDEIQPSEARTFSSYINVHNHGISDLTGIEHFTKITSLTCSYNNLTSVDISKNTSLKNLNCYNNNISSLDVSSNILLKTIDCKDNDLTVLDVKMNTLLEDLDCSNNSLSELDVRNNPLIEELFCGGNALISLDLRNGNNTIISDIWAIDNPDLTCVSVDSVELSEMNWSDAFDTWVTFSLDCNPIPEDETIANTSFSIEDTTCYGAYQTITVGDIVENPVDFNVGSSTSLIAGSSITFLPGVHIYEGAYLTATITTDSSFCDVVEALGSPVMASKPDEKSELVDTFQPQPLTELSMKVFPNPNEGRFSLELLGFSATAELIIYNSLGAVVCRKELSGSNELFDMNELRRGLYFIKAFDASHTLTQKMIVE